LPFGKYNAGIRCRFEPDYAAWIESFNGKFKDKCLNLHAFSDMNEVQKIVEEWKDEYNTIRPHSSLGNVPPAVYAKTIRKKLSFQT